MTKKELDEALQQRNWNGVLQESASILHDKDCPLEATRLAMNTALFVLENEEMQSVSSALVQIVRNCLSKE